MQFSVDVLGAIVVNLITLGAFYGAVKTEIAWIKKSIEKLENKLEGLSR